jgi:hypothetical protein
MDNKPIKDGLGNLFTLRMKDVSAAGDGSIQQPLMAATLYPISYGAGGIYQHCARAPQLGPGLNSVPIYSYRHSSATLLAAISKVRLTAWTTTPGFSPGYARFSLYTARLFTAQDTGGTAISFAGNVNKLATSMAPSVASIVYANTVPLTPGTRILDTDPLESLVVVAPTAASTPFTATPMLLLDKKPGEHPLLLANNEGFVVQTTVPFGGNWQFAVTLEWAEVPVF